MAKQEVQLTAKDSNDVYWEDVDIQKGVYCIDSEQVLRFLTGNKNVVNIVCVEDATPQGKLFNNVLDVINFMGNDWDLYTIPDNRRITTQKPLTVEDFKNNSHVGFTTISGKGHIVHYRGFYMGILVKDGSHENYPHHTLGSKKHESLVDVILNNDAMKAPIQTLFLFDSNLELYQWLAED